MKNDAIKWAFLKALFDVQIRHGKKLVKQANEYQKKYLDKDAKKDELK